MSISASGAVSLNTIHTEAGGTSGTTCSLGDSDIRAIIGNSSGANNMNAYRGFDNEFTMTCTRMTWTFNKNDYYYDGVSLANAGITNFSGGSFSGNTINVGGTSRTVYGFFSTDGPAPQFEVSGHLASSTFSQTFGGFTKLKNASTGVTYFNSANSTGRSNFSSGASAYTAFSGTDSTVTGLPTSGTITVKFAK